MDTDNCVVIVGSYGEGRSERGYGGIDGDGKKFF